MAFPWGAVIGAGASIAGGLIQRGGISDANKANLAIARENRAWQERMSNTAYQRAAKDLHKAGLNRILAIGSPASTPTGNIATMQSTQGPVGKAVSSAVQVGLEIQRRRKENELLHAQGVKTKEEAVTERVRRDSIQSTDALTQAQTRNVLLQHAGITTAQEIQKLNKEIVAAHIPGAESEAEFWRWLQNADMDELTKGLGKAGPVLGGLIKGALLLLRKPPVINRGGTYITNYPR